MKRYVIAVSGGVDSVVLLDMLVSKHLPVEKSQLVVAHFDHGIREESASDADFVRQLAESYELQFETKREELGKDASEEKARERRYTFLREIAGRYNGQIVTAHHADDLIETIAINLIRGTGWRGLAVLANAEIWRPLVDKSKVDLIAYAKKRNLEWREDTTNQDTKYLRNDVRKKLKQLDNQGSELVRRYRDRQVFLRNEVDNELSRLVGASPYRRHLFIVVPERIAIELLRAVFVNERGYSPTRPQILRTLHAIKVLHDGKRYEAAESMTLHFTKTHFVVE